MASNSNKKPKVPKIKISPTDLKTFLVEHMEVDPYWNDLYTAPPKQQKKRRP